MWPCSSQMALTLRIAKGKALLSGLFRSCVAVCAASVCDLLSSNGRKLGKPAASA